MSVTQPVINSDLEQQRLLPVFVTALRQRFKGEVNRLTAGGMAAQLSDHKEANELSFFMSYVQIWHWLQHNIPRDYQTAVLEAFLKGKQGFLMRLLLDSQDAESFVRGYIEHWQNAPQITMAQGQHCLGLLHQEGNNVDALVTRILNIWKPLNPFTRTYKVAYSDLAREERDRYKGMLGPEDKERLALVDALPDTVPAERPRFDKLGLIPAMGCPQTCRHCMFIYRPPMKDNPDPQDLMDQVSDMTNSVLFTGGDLTRQLDSFYQAVSSMRNISNFAILLNGDFANDRDTTRKILDAMAGAVRRRPINWPKARILLQISFDEFHQEVVVNKKGKLEERIPIRKIANIVEAAPKYHDALQLALLHKQHSLNFSTDVFEKGVFARLAGELGERGHRVQVVDAKPSARLKRNPLNPNQDAAPVVKDASFILERYPKAPILFTSSTIDAFGRATQIDPSEAVRERDLLEQVLSGNGAGGESFDKDLMFWFNGWATLFSAVHMCLGNVYEDGMDTVLRRQQIDPLTKALNKFDLRLLDLYREKADDLDEIIEVSTSPHHIFHTITEDPAMRLHMTKRLIAN